MLRKKLLQIDSCLVTGSTGRITENVAKIALKRGWDCYIVHGARYVKRPSCMNSIQSVSIVGEYEHFFESFLFDNHGLASRKATRSVINSIKQIQPDVIQLHCVHGYYLNYKLLFEYLNSTNIPVVWTFHDCWAFTGHCAHFVTANCEKWKTGCNNCQLKNDYPRSLLDRSQRNYHLKKSLFSANNNLHIVPVCDWMDSFVGQSFLKNKERIVIKNGVDLDIFKPASQEPNSKIRVLGVSGVWTKDKGLFDFYKLREYLPIDKFEIVLIGLSKDQVKALPSGIIGIEHTESTQELAYLYSSSSVFLNLTYADTFPTVNLEALACGTPVLTYRTGGSPETISSETGWVVDAGDIEAVVRVLKSFLDLDKSAIINRREACRRRAEQEFNKDLCYSKYIELYERLSSTTT